MSIDHLDFNTPDLPELTTDEYGMPLYEGRGIEVWRGLVDMVNRNADAEGWDMPAQLHTINAPVTVAAELADLNVTAQQVIKDIHDVDLPEDGVVVGYGSALQGYVSEHTLEELWGEDPKGVPAMLLGREVWFTPYPDMPVPAGAWREHRDNAPAGTKDKKGKKKGKRPEADPNARLECRVWTVVTRSGTSFSHMYVRTGKRTSKFLSESEASGLPAAVLHRMYGRSVSTLPGYPPLSVPQFLAVGAAAQALNVSLTRPELTGPMVASYLMMCSGPLQLPFTDEDDTALRSLAHDLTRGQELVDIITRNMVAASPLPTWVEAFSNGPASSALYRDWMPVPGQAAWAGEELLALMAGASMWETIERLPHLVADAGPDAVRIVRDVLTACNLPVPDGL